MRKTPLVLAAAAVALALALVGCSSSKDKAKVDSSSAPPVSLSGAVTDKGTKDASGDGATPTLELEVDDNYFNPTFTQFAPGAVVTVQLKNEGTREHTFTLADGSVDQTLSPDQSAEVKVTVGSTGSVNFFCRIHHSSGMQGAFSLTSASGSGSGGASASTTTTTAGSTTTTARAYGGY